MSRPELFTSAHHKTIREVQHIPSGISLRLVRDNYKSLYFLHWLDKNRKYLDSLYLPSFVNEDKALKTFNSYFWMIPEGDLIYAK